MSQINLGDSSSDVYIIRIVRDDISPSFPVDTMHECPQLQHSLPEEYDLVNGGV